MQVFNSTLDLNAEVQIGLEVEEGTIEEVKSMSNQERMVFKKMMESDIKRCAQSVVKASRHAT